MKKSKFKVKLTVQTPLSVGNDKSEVLSPLCDYIIKKGVAHYIDHEKFGRLVSEKGLMDELIRGSKGISNNRTSFDLKKFISYDLGVDVDTIVKYRLPVNGKVDRIIQLRPLLKTAGQPFVPGSTIKGAFKTALLYHWLSNSERGQRYINTTLTDIQKIYEENEDFVRAIEESKHEIDKLTVKVKRAGSDYNLRKRLNDQQKTLKKQVNYDEKVLANKTTRLKRNLDEAITELFGKLKNDNDSLHDFYCLQISDSSNFKMEDAQISEIKRLHLQKAEFQTPQYLETLTKNASAEFEISIIPEIKQRDLSFFNTNGIESLWEIVNNFSKASTSLDWDILDSNVETFENKNARESNPEKRAALEETYNALFNFYEEYDTQIGAVANTAHIRLGFGKTYFDNSLGLAIHDKDPKVFLYYVKLLQLGKQGQTEFPVTRTVCTDLGVPMGWVTLKY